MTEQIEIAEDVRREAEKTISALKSIGSGDGKTVEEVRDRLLD